MIQRLAPPLKDLPFSCGGALKHTKMVDPMGRGAHLLYIYIMFSYIFMHTYTLPDCEVTF